MLRFEPLPATRDVAELLTQWYNDKAAAHLIRMNRKEQPIEPVTVEGVLDEIQPKDNVWRYGVYLNEELIAEATLMVNPLLFLRDADSSAWLSLVIAPEHRNHGYGVEILNFLEQEATKRFFSRIEFGTFANNEAGIKLYTKAGYQQFDTIPRFTWYDGAWIDDLRFSKRLPQTSASLLADAIAGLIHLLKSLKAPQATEIQEQLLQFRNQLDISAYRSDASLNSVTLKLYFTPGKEKIENAIFVGLRHLSYQLLQAYKQDKVVNVYELEGIPALLSALDKGFLTKLIDDIMRM